MMYRKEEYIDELIQKIQDLETRVVSVKTEDALSFSFFRDAFQKVQSVMKVLHELEMQQIEDMKKQMEKLVAFLSETETQNNNKAVEAKPIDNNKPTSSVENVVKVDSVENDEDVTQTDVETSDTNVRIDGIVLPVYTNPRKENEDDSSAKTKDSMPAAPEITTHSNNNHPSLNDVLHAPPSRIEMKRNLSLNDRFFYQRELFDNNRDEMTKVMYNINKLGTIEEVENYLRNTTSWNFEDENVKGFLELLGKT